jgi:uracil-DNA glycosylase
MNLLMSRVQAKIQGCTLCPLHKVRRNIVIGRGSFPADVLFIGEGPGKTEDIIGQAFVGKAGKLLDQLCADAGLAFCTKYFTNVVLCHPTDTFDGLNREPQKNEIALCLSNVDFIIGECKPKVVVLAGSIAQKYYGDIDICPIVHIQHPSFLLRTGGVKSPYYTKNVHALEELNDYV